MRLFVLVVFLGVAACSHNVGAPPPSTAQPAGSSPIAGSLGPGNAQPVAAPVVGGESIAANQSGALPGIEKFDRSITPLTMICGADIYNVRYSQIAQNRLAAAVASRPGPKQIARIDKVDMRIRCHSQGISGTQNRCYGDAVTTVTMLDQRGNAAAPTFEVAGRSSESAVFTCISGGQAIGQALDNMLGRLSDRISSGQ